MLKRPWTFKDSFLMEEVSAWTSHRTTDAAAVVEAAAVASAEVAVAALVEAVVVASVVAVVVASVEVAVVASAVVVADAVAIVAVVVAEVVSQTALSLRQIRAPCSSILVLRSLSELNRVSALFCFDLWLESVG